MKASEFLTNAVKHLKERGERYDLNGEEERSMKKTVGVFNVLTNHVLTEYEGWVFMCVLKMVRAQQGNFHADNFEDLASYAGLAGECAAKAPKEMKPDYYNDWPESELQTPPRTPPGFIICLSCGEKFLQSEAACPYCERNNYENSNI
jgi:hypothetical protein